MTKQTMVLIALFAGWIFTFLTTRSFGRGHSKRPEHVALQTRQDIGSVYGCLIIMNGLLAAILAALVY